MNRFDAKLCAALAAALALAACGPRDEGNAAARNGPGASTPSAVDNMAAIPAGEAKAVATSGIGEVMAVDPKAGTITISHGPLPAAGWPAMTMTFDAKPPILSGVAVGDSIAFDVTVKGNGGEVTAIRKR